MKREAVVAVLSSEGLALESISARTASSVVVVPTPTDTMEFRKSTRDLKAQSTAKEHSDEVRDGGRDPDVRRPGAGLGQSPARSKFFRAAFAGFVCSLLSISISPFLSRSFSLSLCRSSSLSLFWSMWVSLYFFLSVSRSLALFLAL